MEMASGCELSLEIYAKVEFSASEVRQELSQWFTVGGEQGGDASDIVVNDLREGR